MVDVVGDVLADHLGAGAHEGGAADDRRHLGGRRHEPATRDRAAAGGGAAAGGRASAEPEELGEQAVPRRYGGQAPPRRQVDAGAHEQRLDGGHRRVQRGRELGVAEPLELAHQQRRALLGRQAPHVLDELADVLAPLGLGNGVAQRRVVTLEDLAGRHRRTAQLVDAAVVGHAVQPRPQRHRALAGPQRRVGAQEDVLQRVLGILARSAQHLTGVGEQPLAVAIVDRPERVVVAAAEERDELLVRPQARLRAARSPNRRYRRVKD